MTKVKIVRLAMLLILSIVMLLSMNAMALADVTTAREAADGVVLITEETEDVYGFGSGFAIGESGKPVRYIVTNFHVVRDAYYDGGTITVYFSAAANSYMQSEIYWKDEKKDIAILRLPEATDLRSALVICPNKEIDLNGNFTALGYPSSSTAGNDFIKYDKSDIAITQGIISKEARIDETDVYMIDIDISEGNSGGPLVNSKGEVVGINTFSIKSDTGSANYAVMIDELVRSINRDIIPITITGTGNNMVLIIGLSICALVVIIVVVLLILIRRKSNTSKQTGTTKATVKNKFTLVGTNGYFAGRNFPLNSDLKIGRDPKRCTIIYPAEQAGISSLHCEITLAGNNVMLQDCGSSYGTFLNGEKLAARSPKTVKKGDVFYLADESNTFRVE
ncbi:MAG: hypothetical protein K0S76_2188 [Herbinix sp.]|jgi:V8-like Glu-specific endopeptidase|nr:hypothetical protein [Herbinix sp.]